jgi:hypothetical protein
MQHNFDAIFASEQTTAESSFNALVSMMQKHTQLSKYVS